LIDLETSNTLDALAISKQVRL